MTGLNFQTETIVNDKSLLLKDDGVLGVKYGPSFAEADVKVIRKAEGHEAVPHKFEITLSAPADGVAYYSLNLSINMQGAEPFIYSNAMAKKYIPLCVEFSVAKGATKIAEAVKKVIDKNQLFVIGNALLKVSAADNKLTIETAEEFQRISKCELVNITDENAPVVSKIEALTPAPQDSFGTYSYLVKNLRLPTAENLRWLSPAKVEYPVVGAIYDQYIFEVEAPASNGGLHAVGQRMNSHTVHVFWVKRDSKDEATSVWTPTEEAYSQEASVLND